MTAFLGTLVVLLLAIYVTVLIRDWKTWDPDTHTTDCLTWRPIGIEDVTCPAPHPTDWFTPESEATK